MFAVGNRVRIVMMEDALGTIKGLIRTDDDREFYLVDVDGYSDSPSARAINAMAGLDHGYVPLLETDLAAI